MPDRHPTAYNTIAATIDNPITPPRNLVVIGAAGGVGRWIGDHLLSACAWEHVTLIDAAEHIRTLDHGYDAAADVQCAQVVTRSGELAQFTPPLTDAFDRPATLVCIAVPLDTLDLVAGWLLPRLAVDAIVVDLSHDRASAEATIGGVRPELASFGLHCLFGVTAESAEGQIFAVCPSPVAPDAHRWIVAKIEAAGGTVNLLTAGHHDNVMRYVQTAAHHALLTFAGVIGSSGLDLEHDLWANRTPVFELMLALAGRVLAPGQDQTAASIQAADPHGTVAAQFAESSARIANASARHELPDVLESLRAPFPGALFTKVQQAGALATSAVQSTRARVSHHRGTAELIGVRSLVPGDRLHVGRIEKVTATSFTMRDLLVGARGRAALLSDDHAIANARKLGVGGKARVVEFSLGRVQILSPLELDGVLDDWLATVQRGCKFLIPDSISGASAVRVVESVPGVERAELVSEEVRLGQRECVAKFWARVDRNLFAVERDIQHRIDEVFVWPDGVVLPIAPDGPASDLRIGFLAPAGTFSDVAARQLARLLGVPDATRVEHLDFGAIVDALQAGTIPIGVVPITNSSSGLVDLAAAVLGRSTVGEPGGLEAGGVVDVPVRFDAYVARGTDFVPGSIVYSHPQGFRQCSAFIAANRLVEVACTSTADACIRVAETGAGVAVAATGLDEEFGVALARASVGNLAGALTRFLVLGRPGTFAAPPRADATLRSLWVLDAADGGVLPVVDEPQFDEVLRGPSGATLVVSTRRERIAPGPGRRYLGTIPWSPRTPIVAV